MVRSPLSGLAPARRRTAVVVLVSLLVVLVAVLGRLAVNRLAGGGIAEQASPGPVLVVPGYGGDTSSLDPLVAELRREGRDVVVFTPSQGGTGDLEVQARRLSTLVDETRKGTGAASVDLVGYSAGGVVARLYVRFEGGGPLVRRVLTLGSPQHGTDVAVLAEEVAGGCPVACEQLATGSDLLRRLNAGDETPSGPQWITVRTRNDQIVTPSDSAMLQGALNIEVQQVCPQATTSHDALPGDPVVLAALRAVLERDLPRLPGKVTC